MKHSELRHQPRHVNPRIQVSAQAAKGSKKTCFSVCGKKERLTGYELQRM